MSRKEKVKVFKIILMILVIVLFVGLAIYLVPVIKELSTLEGQIAFKEKVASMGWIGLLLLFGLQLAQIFLIVLPGEPMEVLAGMCYGGIGGTLFITGSVFLITMLIFFTVRKLGKKFVYDFCDDEKIDKIMNSKVFRNPKKVEWIMIILFLLPGTPKDLLVYISGLLPLKPVRFILISTFARLPSVISSTFAGANLVSGNWQLGLIIYAVIFVLIVAVIFIINKFDKSKAAEEAISSLKDM